MFGGLKSVFFIQSPSQTWHPHNFPWRFEWCGFRAFGRGAHDGAPGESAFEGEARCGPLTPWISLGCLGNNNVIVIIIVIAIVIIIMSLRLRLAPRLQNVFQAVFASC